MAREEEMFWKMEAEGAEGPEAEMAWLLIKMAEPLGPPLEPVTSNLAESVVPGRTD